MLDIVLDDDWDIKLGNDGDILIDEDGISQAIQTRLKWFEGEWRLGPGLGFPWYDDVFIKNPDLGLIKRELKDEIMSVDGVTSCEVTIEEFDKAERTIKISYRAHTSSDDTVSGEVSMSG